MRRFSSGPGHLQVPQVPCEIDCRKLVFELSDASLHGSDSSSSFCSQSLRLLTAAADEEEDSEDEDEEAPVSEYLSVQELIQTNNLLHKALNACKNMISRHYHNRRWDVCKRFTNEFELIFTSNSDMPGLSSFRPISRSFFKLWEILLDFEALEDAPWSSRRPIKVAFLAEGPGGFVESLIKYRKEVVGHAGDELHGMTLLSKNRSIPCWKLPALEQQRSRLCVHRGADGTGDLYQLRNIDNLIDKVGRNSCDLVTADGGFDFSSDFNNQELNSTRLIISEVLSALLLQRPGGAFVIKVYDMYTMSTLRIVYALRQAYAAVRIVKPSTSRPANSEKYLVCTGFRGACRRTVGGLRMACADPGNRDRILRDALNAPIPAGFLRDVVEYNRYYVSRQIVYICRTLFHIQDHPLDKSPPLSSETSVLRRQLAVAIRWCHKYRIPACLSALHRYKALLLALERSSD